jgi:hypothetical protein
MLDYKYESANDTSIGAETDYSIDNEMEPMRASNVLQNMEI